MFVLLHLLNDSIYNKNQVKVYIFLEPKRFLNAMMSLWLKTNENEASNRGNDSPAPQFPLSAHENSSRICMQAPHKARRLRYNESMITQEDLKLFRGAAFTHADDHLYAPPHVLLRPYISNYTVSFPTPQAMPDAYTILPSASCTLVVSVDGSNIVSRLRGVNTVACPVGAHANRMRLLVLIEFRPGGLHPFLPVDQQELLDTSVGLDILSAGLARQVRDALESAPGIQALLEALDGIFLGLLCSREQDRRVAAILRGILARHGEVAIGELAREVHYSEKQLRRVFLHHVGASPKLFSRVARVNYALRLLQRRPARLTDVAAQAGYFDQPHLIHDFQTICGLTPQQYQREMSVFYNDRFKM